MDAADEMGKNNTEKALALNNQAIAKFRETLKIDSNHHGARSALAHSLYIDKKFAEAIDWFKQANTKDGIMAVNLRESGLCNINLGQLKIGRSEIEDAFKRDTSKEMRSITVDDLFDIGNLAFNYGRTYTKEGDNQKGLDYQHFAVAVLEMAFDFDNTRKDITKTIVDYADELKDKLLADKYRNR